MKDAGEQVTVRVCRAKSCTRRGAAELAAELQRTLERRGVDASVVRHGCFDLCKGACNALVEVSGAARLYTRLHPRHAAEFAESIEKLAGTPDLVESR